MCYSFTNPDSCNDKPIFRFITFNYNLIFFQEKEYVHVTAETCSTNEVFYKCSCKTFSTLMPLQDNDSVATCCHCRLMQDVIPLIGSDVRLCDNQFLDLRKINEGLKSASANVILLNSKSGVERYSVINRCSAEFVTVFEVAKTSRKIVKCHSSLCKIYEGSTRVISNLGKGVLCPHLKEFANYYRLVQGIPDPDDDSSSGDELDVDSQNNEDILLPQEKVALNCNKKGFCLFHVNIKFERSSPRNTYTLYI